MHLALAAPFRPAQHGGGTRTAASDRRLGAALPAASRTAVGASHARAGAALSAASRTAVGAPHARAGAALPAASRTVVGAPHARAGAALPAASRTVVGAPLEMWWAHWLGPYLELGRTKLLMSCPGM